MPLYFLLYFCIFWVPVFILASFLWKKLDPLTKKAFWIATAIMTFLTTVMEYVFLGFRIWTFSQNVDPLLGIWVGPVPVEEFVFWFGASPLFIFLYLAFDRWDRRTGDRHA